MNYPTANIFIVPRVDGKVFGEGELVVLHINISVAVIVGGRRVLLEGGGGGEE